MTNVASNGQPATTAERAADFVDALGVNIHTTYIDTSYGEVNPNVPPGSPGSLQPDPTKIENALAYLGIDRVRDTAPDINSWTLSMYETEAAAGMKFDFVIPGGTVDLPGVMAGIDDIASKYPGSVVAVEGPNEVNGWPVTYDGQTGMAAAAALQKAIYAEVTSDPHLKGVPVYALTLGGATPDQYAPLGDLSAYATNSNAHIYYGAQPPEGSIIYGLWVGEHDAPADPPVITETGIYTATPQPGTNATNTDVQAQYILDSLMDAAKNNVSDTYLYELLDEGTDPTVQEQNFGLFYANGTPKPVATAIHNLTTILADTGGTATTFAPGQFAYSVNNLPRTEVAGFTASGSSLLLEKSSGAYDIVVWTEPPLWNQATATENTVGPSATTITFNRAYQTVKVFDPMQGSQALRVLHNVSSVSVMLTAHPVIVEVEPNATARQPAVAAAPVTASALTAVAVPQAAAGATTSNAAAMSVSELPGLWGSGDAALAWGATSSGVPAPATFAGSAAAISQEIAGAAANLGQLALPSRTMLTV
ncbi:MAG TPA: hypothetical protein VMI52_02860 [Acetobacteraceae bacterium]|nr:hypothetical protein [Acetobacteraceae bacterium]